MRLPKSSSTRWLLGACVVILIIIVVSIVLGLTVGRDAPSLSEDTPEGVVQRYILALRAGDAHEAYAYMSSELQTNCTYTQFANVAREWLSENVRVELEETTISGDAAWVRVRVVHRDGSFPFGSSEWSDYYEFALARENYTWMFSEPPPPAWACPDFRKKLETLTPVPTPASTPAQAR